MLEDCNVQRLGQISVEACADALLPVFVACVSRQGHRAPERLALPCFHHQLEAVAVWQADITQKHVKRETVQQIERVVDIASREDVISVSDKKTRQHHPGIGMILYIKNAQGLQVTSYSE